MNQQQASDKRPIVLVFLRHYVPGYQWGGPIRSMSNLVEVLGDEFDFRIVTTDRDVLDDVPYPGIPTHQWVRTGKAWAYYVPAADRSVGLWRRLLSETKHDAVYLHSIFDPFYATLPILAWRRLPLTARKPLMLAPRGELSPGALQIKSWKKLPFLKASRWLGLYRGIHWQATTEHEARMIARHFGDALHCLTAPNLPAMPPAHARTPAARLESSPLRVVFLSRVVPKKNLAFALKVLNRCRSAVNFDIWGAVVDPTYWSECQALIARLPPHVKVSYRGVAEHPQVAAIMGEYDLFFLPTLGENYGHVIAEALSSGTPVLLSDATPWRGLASVGVGWDLPLDAGESAFADAIEQAAQLALEQGQAWRERVHRFAVARLSDPARVESSRQMFETLIATAH